MYEAEERARVEAWDGILMAACGWSTCSIPGGAAGIGVGEGARPRFT